MRPSWDEYFMAMADLCSERSTCIRRQVGAVLVRDKRILATGYSGAPTGVEHCSPHRCVRERQGVPSGERHELCIGVHAEQNAILQCAVVGVSTPGSTMYCTCQPCILCAKMLISAGVQRVVFRGEYPDALACELLATVDVQLVQVS